MTDRDHFASSALTGLLAAPTDKDRSSEYWARFSYEIADAMLRQRDKHPAPPCVETDGFSSDSRTGQINRTPECESPRRECGESSLRDVPQLDNSRAAGGPELQISESEIDALECVVEDGRIVGMSVYGRLRSLLVRLRPEWESDKSDRSTPVKDDVSDRSKPINDDRLAALEELSALDQKLELEYGLTGNPLIKAQRSKESAKTDTTPPRNSALSGRETVPGPDSRVCETPCTPQPHATPTHGSVQDEGSFRVSRNAKEPVAWLIQGVEYDSGCEYEYVTNFKENSEAAAAHGGRVVPLYRQPQPTLTDAEREAIKAAERDYGDNDMDAGCWRMAATLRGLLERMK